MVSKPHPVVGHLPAVRWHIPTYPNSRLMSAVSDSKVPLFPNAFLSMMYSSVRWPNTTEPFVSYLTPERNSPGCLVNSMAFSMESSALTKSEFTPT